MAQALADAHQRGVGVQMVLDETTVSSRPSDAGYGILRDTLGTDTTQSSFVTLCPAGKSCLGRTEFGTSINHNKFWLFSQVDGASDVVLQTSSNMSPSAYSAFWNDAHVVACNTGIYNAYSGYFTALVGKDWQNWRCTSSSWSPYKAYFFPCYPGTGNSTDTVWNTLDNVTCTYTQDGATKRTKVRVAMFKFTRQGVADKLVALKKAGCSVELVYTSTDSKDSSGTAGTWETLHSASGFSPVCYHDDHDSDPATAARIMHSKYLLIDGKYDGAVNKVLWTGSHNYSGPALRENDEFLLKVDDSAAHDAYVANFDAARAAARPGTNDATPACKGVVNQPEQARAPPSSVIRSTGEPSYGRDTRRARRCSGRAARPGQQSPRGDAADPAGQLPRGLRHMARDAVAFRLVGRVAGEGDGDAGDRVGVVVQHGRGDGREARGDLALLRRVPPAPGLCQQTSQRRQRGGAGAVPHDERGPVREDRPHLRGRQQRQHRPATGGQMGRQPHPDLTDQRRPARGAFLDDVDDLTAVQHGEVGVVTGAVDECGQRRPGQSLERCLPLVARGQFERADAEAVAPLLRQVHHEAVRREGVEQVVRRRAWQTHVAADGSSGDGSRLPRQVAQHGEHLPGGRDDTHGVRVDQDGTGPCPTPRTGAAGVRDTRHSCVWYPRQNPRVMSRVLARPAAS